MNQIPILQSLFARDLERLHEEVVAYAEDRNLWLALPGTINSGGNLALHLVGNLNTYICDQIGKSGYVRDRAAEFNRKDVPRAELLKMIAATKTQLFDALAQMPTDQLDEEYPVLVFPEPMATGWFLFHLHSHLAYHLGQINYHRRIAEGA